MRAGQLLAFRAAPAAPYVGSVGDWSNPTTWGGSKPTAGQAVTIGSGQTVTLDENTPSLGKITIAAGGTLQVKQGATVYLTCTAIEVLGTFLCGTEAAPFAGYCVVTLTGAEAGRANRFVADYLSSSGNVQRTGTGNGTLKQLICVSGAVAETITVTWSSSTAFSVSGSVSGALGAGTVGTWFSNRVEFMAVAGGTAWAASDTMTITVVQQGATNDGAGRSIIVQPGGRWEFIGSPPATPWTRLAAHYTANATAATLRSMSGWKRGDKIVASGTDWIDNAQGRGTARRTHVKSVDSATAATLSGGFAGDRWGLIQYQTDSGWSLSAGTLTRPSDAGNVATYIPADAWANIPKQIDQSAVVINLSRNIIVQGVEDTAWTGNAFGAHTMVMGLSSIARINGVEFRRMGQAGAIGRYPFHWHMLSYGGQKDGNMNKPSDGTVLGDANPLNHYITNCAIYDSGQRMIVVHGTCGVLVRRNVGHNITGHAIFLEDGAEERNTIEYNVVLGVAPPTAGNKLIESDRAVVAGGGESGSTGYWISNVNNTLRYNVCIGAETPVWDASGSIRCHGLCRDVAIAPQQRPTIEFHHNEGAVGRGQGFTREDPPMNHFHNVFGSKYEQSDWAITDNVTWKNLLGGYRNRLVRVSDIATKGYRRWTAVDNGRLVFSGATGNGVNFVEALVSGKSLNSADDRYTSTKTRGFSSYDQGFEVRHCIFSEFPTILGGSTDVDSYGNIVPGVQHLGMICIGEYLPPLAAFTQYYGYKLVNVDATKGGMITPRQISGVNTLHKGSVGVTRDTYGIFTGTAGRHLIYDAPFYTFGAADLQNFPGGKSTSTKFYAVNPMKVSGVASGTMYLVRTPVTYTRINPSTGASEGTWACPDGASNFSGLDQFRMAGVPQGGVIQVVFDGNYADDHLIMSVYYARDAADEFTIGLPWPNGQALSQVAISRSENLPGGGEYAANFARLYDSTGMTSRTDVQNDSTGTKYWRDTTNNVIWVKWKGGLIPYNLDTVTFANEYPAWSIHIKA